MQRCMRAVKVAEIMMFNMHTVTATTVPFVAIFILNTAWIEYASSGWDTVPNRLLRTPLV